MRERALGQRGVETAQGGWGALREQPADLQHIYGHHRDRREEKPQALTAYLNTGRIWYASRHRAFGSDRTEVSKQKPRHLPFRRMDLPDPASAEKSAEDVAIIDEHWSSLIGRSR